ncbi:hypothetical protein ACINWC743_A0675 [Acinetobacter sp. WC-743]|nr:hypothetical protein ACINWC743_A0675 [Acinetobacter sp. WC-743]
MILYMMWTQSFIESMISICICFKLGLFQVMTWNKSKPM